MNQEDKKEILVAIESLLDTKLEPLKGELLERIDSNHLAIQANTSAIELLANTLQNHIESTEQNFARVDQKFDEVAQEFKAAKEHHQEIITAVNRNNARLADHEMRIERIEEKVL